MTHSEISEIVNKLAESWNEQTNNYLKVDNICENIINKPEEWANVAITTVTDEPPTHSIKHRSGVAICWTRLHKNESDFKMFIASFGNYCWTPLNDMEKFKIQQALKNSAFLTFISFFKT